MFFCNISLKSAYVIFAFLLFSVLYKKVYLSNLLEKLELINPMGVLKRGYSLSMQDDSIIKSVKDININKELLVRLHDGNIITSVLKIEENNNE